jgi:hypothetical protein
VAKNGSVSAPHHHRRQLSEAAAKRRLREAQHREESAPTRRIRNEWKGIVRKREHQLTEVVRRHRREEHPHVVTHKHRPGGLHFTVEGGTPTERLLYACRYAHKTARLHYLEGGDYTHGFALTNVPSDIDRSDCSWWYCELFAACGLRDPLEGDTTRFTGSILEKGRPVSRRYAETHVGVAVVFGSGVGFHVGMSTGTGPNIWQHGTPTFRKGTFDEFGPGVEVRYRAFDMVAK